MKLLICRVNARGKRSNRVRFDIEKILFSAFIITFTITIVLQVALMSPSVRTFLSTNGQYEGDPLGAEEYLYKAGSMTLKLSSGDKNTDLTVAVNGDTATVFSTSTVELSVKNGDIVELDGSGLKKEAELEIAGVSENVTTDLDGKKIKLQPGSRKTIKLQVD